MNIVLFYSQLALSSSNKLYVWGSSPQVLRLQAQAQKKARLFQQQQQQQHPSSVSAPPSPLKSVHVQKNTTTQAAHVGDTVKDSQESTSTFHNPTFVEPVDPGLSDFNLTSVSSALNSSQSSSNNRVSPVRKHCFKSENTSQSSLPISSFNNNVNISLDTSDKCHKVTKDGSSNNIVLLDKKKIDSSHIPITVNDPELLETSNYRNGVQAAPSASDTNVPIHLKNAQASSTSVFSDFENANVDTKSDGSFQHSPSARRVDHSLNLQVRTFYFFMEMAYMFIT